GRFLFFLFTCLGYSAFYGLPLILIRNFLGMFMKTRDSDQFWKTTGLLGACWLMLVYFRIRRDVTGRYIEHSVVRDATDRVVAHLLGQPLGLFDRWRSGELISRIGGDAGALSMTVRLFTVMVREPISALAVIGYLVSMNWKLALLGLVGFPLAAYPIAVLSRRVRQASRKARESAADRSDAMVQFLGGMRVVKGFGREDLEATRFAGKNSAIFNHTMKGARAGANLGGAVELVNGIGGVALVIAGGLLIVEWQVDWFGADEFMTFLIALVMLHQPTRALSQANRTVQQSLPGAERLFELLDVEEKLPVPAVPARPGPLSDAIRLRRVSFSYGREEVLKGVDIDVEARKTTAIVGPSGSGKSTVLNLVARFYDPDWGSVAADGTDLRDVEPKVWRERIGLVTQEPVLFNSTIRDNIRYGRLDATDAEIKDAARLADIHDDIVGFPQGYDTLAGERGGQLSGGQRQRICLARAMVRNPSLLLLDEATSSLDSASEKVVQEAIDRVEAGRTSVVVAHRLSTVRNADRIYVLVGGEVEASGPHEELLKESPTYKHLWDIQRGAPIDG
ncbi:MAG: ABC transporter ATP-binding protein, partial [Planctomycetota bacterium]